jgi:8-oxo-dGTP pyrophosphatase MutT (NUDIX family)
MTIIAAGAIVYRAGRGFLLLRNRDYWEFPKGRADDDDADILATALREVGEETGLTDVTLIEGFREEEHYTVTRGPKMVTYFLARTKQEPTLSKEHRGYCWCTAREVEEFIRYEAKRVVFRKALAFLKKTSHFNAKDLGAKRRRKPRTKSSSQKNGSATKK